MTHAQLVNSAKDWLLGAKDCNPVFTERGSAKVDEMPDAIGWTSEDCIVVECKTSLADFNQDKKKPFRWNGRGLGNLRFYLLEWDEMWKGGYPELPEGWGLLTIPDGSFAHQVRFKGSDQHKRNIELENRYLRSRLLEIQRFGK